MYCWEDLRSLRCVLLGGREVNTMCTVGGREVATMCTVGRT